MKYGDKVKNLEDVYNVAKTLFPCKVTVDARTGGFGERSNGTRTIKLIVGKKKNPVFDPNITDPNNNLGKPSVADVRIISIMPGITVKELLENHLMSIKNSLERKEDIIDDKITGIEPSTPKINIPNDNELADELLKDGGGVIGDEEWAEKSEDVSWEEKQIKGVNNTTPENISFLEDKRDSRLDDVLTGISQLNDNLQIVAEDVNKINSRVEVLEKNKQAEKAVKEPEKKTIKK